MTLAVTYAACARRAAVRGEQAAHQQQAPSPMSGSISRQVRVLWHAPWPSIPHQGIEPPVTGPMRQQVAVHHELAASALHTGVCAKVRFIGTVHHMPKVGKVVIKNVCRVLSKQAYWAQAPGRATSRDSTTLAMPPLMSHASHTHGAAGAWVRSAAGVRPSPRHQRVPSEEALLKMAGSMAPRTLPWHSLPSSPQSPTPPPLGTVSDPPSKAIKHSPSGHPAHFPTRRQQQHVQIHTHPQWIPTPWGPCKAPAVSHSCAPRPPQLGCSQWAQPPWLKRIRSPAISAWEWARQCGQCEQGCNAEGAPA